MDLESNSPGFESQLAVDLAMPLNPFNLLSSDLENGDTIEKVHRVAVKIK